MCDDVLALTFWLYYTAVNTFTRRQMWREVTAKKNLKTSRHSRRIVLKKYIIRAYLHNICYYLFERRALLKNMKETYVFLNRWHFFFYIISADSFRWIPITTYKVDHAVNILLDVLLLKAVLRCWIIVSLKPEGFIRIFWNYILNE